jgi:hypothetical protein
MHALSHLLCAIQVLPSGTNVPCQLLGLKEGVQQESKQEGTAALLAMLVSTHPPTTSHPPPHPTPPHPTHPPAHPPAVLRWRASPAPRRRR